MNPQGTYSTPEIARLKDHLMGVVLREMEARPPIGNTGRKEIINQYLKEAYQSLKIQLPNSVREQIFHEIMDDLLGFGVLQPLLDDPDINEIMVNGPKLVFVERKGKLVKTNITFENDEQVIRLIDKIILPLGRRIDHDSPTVDARLPDGSRVNAVIPPVTIDGPTNSPSNNLSILAHLPETWLNLSEPVWSAG
jgi:pilus assembly protein CpaF